MSGLNFLRRLLMKEAMKKSAPFQHEGIMSINRNLVNEVEATVKKWKDSAKKQGQDIDKMGEQEIKYIVELNKPKSPTVISQGHPQFEELMEKIGLTDPKKNKFLQKEGEVVDMTGKTIDTSKPISGGKNVEVDMVTDTVTKITTMEPVAAMKEANLVIGRKGKYKNLTKEQSQKILKDTDDWIFQRDPDDLYDYNKKRPFRDDPDVDPEDFAYGGVAGMLGERTRYSGGGNGDDDSIVGISMSIEERWERIKKILQQMEDIKSGKTTDPKYDPEEKAHGGRMGAGLNYLLGEDDQNVRVPFKDGTKFNPKRRTVLKGIAALATLPIVGKFFKWAKPAAKIADVTSVPIKNIDGMPVWFKPLVNKVIKEGDDVTKKFATQERQIVHQSALPDSKTPVAVTQDITTGDVVVDIGAGKHGFGAGHLGQPVRLEYKASEVIPLHSPEGSYSKVKHGNKTHTKTKEEFWVEEAEFTGGHPENVKFEESVFSKFGDHGSDFSEVEKFATGKIKKQPLQKYPSNRIKSIDEGSDNWPTAIEKKASGGRVPLSGGGGIMKLLKLLKKKPKKSYERIDLEKLLKGDKKIPVYSGSMKRQSNTWKSFKEDAKQLGTTPEKMAKDKFKDQWFTPFREYAESFTNPKDLTSKMRTVELDPKEIAMAKRYVDKVNKTDIISMRKNLGIKDAKGEYPKQNITTADNLVLIPKIKLKKLKKENRIMTDYLIKEKIKSKLGLAEGGRVSLSAGGVAGMLGE